LEAIRTHFPDKKILLVFGCGGNRDREKRPQMAKIGEQLADYIILTTDNPRDEDPGSIIREVRTGFSTTGHREILDREEAIGEGMVRAQKNGDILLIAGKGHEKYQEVGGQRFPFDDGWVLRQCAVPYGPLPADGRK
jgi:UDP-N-acetylmuramyl tripeptide synthase